MYVQLIRECKEVLHAATDMKQYYQDMVCPVIYDSQNKHDKLTFGLRLFDEDLSRMLEVTRVYSVTFYMCFQNTRISGAQNTWHL